MSITGGRRLPGSPSSFRLDPESPLAFESLWSCLGAALRTGARLLEASWDGPSLVITFDREISQALIVDVLTEGIESE